MKAHSTMLPLILALAGCGAAEELQVAQEEAPLLGHARSSGCGPDFDAYLNRLRAFTRTVQRSTAYESCMHAVFAERHCARPTDVFASEPTHVQALRAIDVRLSLADTYDVCLDLADWVFPYGVGGPATDYLAVLEEDYLWSHDQLAYAIDAPSPSNEATNAWSLVGRQLLHHGYSFGYEVMESCTLDWSLSAPRIAANCTSEILLDSKELCPAACPIGQYNIYHPNTASCQCVADPGWETIGGAALDVSVGRIGTFATSPYNGNLLERQGYSWVVIGGPGRQFVQNDNALYGLTPDGNAILEHTATDWRPIGGPAQSILANGNLLLAIRANGDVLSYDRVHETWRRIGGPFRRVVATRTQIFAISNNGGTTLRYDAATNAWIRIGGAANDLIAGGDRLYMIETNGNVALYQNTPYSWSTIGGPGRAFVANDVALYAQSPGGEAVYRMQHGATNWTAVGNANLERIFAGGNIFVAEHSSGDLMKLINP